MKEAIIEYAKKVSEVQNWWSMEELDKFSEEYKNKYINNNIYFITKSSEVNLTIIEKTLGFVPPLDILEYMNLFWHPCIKGFYKIEESIVLFSVIKYDNESDDDFLYHKYGLLDMAKSWKETAGGDLKRYLPIGWTGYSGGYILYDLKTGMIYEEDFDNVGVPSEEPLANSLEELISNLSVIE